MKNILFVESDPLLLHTMVGLLKNQSNFLHFLSAGSIEDAINILFSEDVHLLIIGMSIQETDAYKLVLLMSNNPEIRIILMTISASSDFCKKIAKMSSIIHFNDIQDISLLTKRIFIELQINFGGQLHTTNIVSFLQMMELEKSYCTLLVSTKGNYGILYFTDGKLVAAKVGRSTGNEAALEILTWRQITIDIDYTHSSMPREINMSLMNLLLASGQITDEKRGQSTTLRKHKRYECHVAAQYEVDNQRFQCFLRDISVGGAYLETDRLIKIGQSLTLFLSESVEESQVPIEGKAVHRDHHGVGVQFKTLTLKQKKLIRSILLSRRSQSSILLNSAA